MWIIDSGQTWWNRNRNNLSWWIQISSKYCNFRDWASKCCKGFIKFNSGGYDISYIIVFSRKKVYGIIASEIIFNTEML